MALKKKILFYFIMLVLPLSCSRVFCGAVRGFAQANLILFPRVQLREHNPTKRSASGPTPPTLSTTPGVSAQFRSQGVSIVCIGDSQTYGSGVGVTREQAWPQRLEKLSGQKTYNMGFRQLRPRALPCAVR